MTDFKRYRDRTRDIQDMVERGVFGKMEQAPSGGAMMSVRGTGTTDVEVPVVNIGYGFNLPENTNAEVVMLSQGSDVNNKVALPQLPRDKQYLWPEGAGGIQNPLDPSKRIEMDGDGTHLTDGTFTAGPNKEITITIDNGNVSISSGGKVTLSADTVAIKGNVEITGGVLTHNGTNIGSTHQHLDVTPGSGKSGGPV